MPIKINVKKSINDAAIKNYVLFSNEDFKINSLNRLSISRFSSNIGKTIDFNKSKKKEILIFNLNPTQKIILVKLKNNMSPLSNEKKGAEFFDFIKSNSIFNSTFLESNFSDILKKNKNFIDEFFHGVKLKSYTFNKYKTKKDSENYEINILFKSKNLNYNKDKRFESLIDGITYTKDLVSEPGNILHPDEYAKRLNALRKYGLKVSVYDQKKLKKLGMNAILGVGQGSIRGSYLVTLEWKGAKSNKRPLGFVGKGVCFDTGGISLKPAKFMEDMTYDMAGSAVVVGLMKNLAKRKAKINAVGVVGLVENMPGGRR